MELEFYKCAHCGQIIKKVVDANVPVVCCGERMQKLEPNSTEAAVEKHLPEMEVKGNQVTVTVSSVEHPMTDAHYIEWVIIATNQGSYKFNFKPGEKPVAIFNLRDGEVAEKAYAYCNLHGLWAK